MTFQAYIDAIEKKSGKKIAELKAEATAKGLTGAAVNSTNIYNWMNTEYGIGRGHAMAFYALCKDEVTPRLSLEQAIDKFFVGPKAHWRPSYDALIKHLRTFGPDVNLAATDTYVSLLRGKAKLGVISVTTTRLDIGIKLKGEPFSERFTDASKWNSMVTHRVQITDPAQINGEVYDWLKRAYDRA